VKIPTTERLTLGRMQNPVRGFLHGSAAVFAAAGTVFLLVQAPSWRSRFALAAFGLGLVALYTTSSLYHSIPWRQVWKRRMQRADHSMIFVLIAGTYTPVSVIALHGTLSVISVIGAWAIAAVGIGQQVLFPRERNTFGIALMTTLGWLALFIMWPFASNAGIAAVVWFAVGGVLYTVGMVMLVTQRPRLWPRVFSYHEVFHVLVVTASALHFAATWRYVVPLAE
jgi:hemolysin III